MPLESTLTDIVARLRQGQFPSSCHPERPVEALSCEGERISVVSDSSFFLHPSAFSGNRLFTKADPEDVGPVTSPGDSPVGTAGPAVRSPFMANINPHSLEVVTAKCEPSVKDAKPELRYQFERLGYFTLDADTKPGALVFNRTITLKDAWAKEVRKG